MDKKDFKELRRGDIIRNKNNAHSYLVDSNHGDRVTAVTTIDVTSPPEWILVYKANYGGKPNNTV